VLPSLAECLDLGDGGARRRLLPRDGMVKGTVAGKITVPKDVHILSHRACGCVTSRGKWDLAGVTRDPEMVRGPWMVGLRGPSVIIRVLEEGGRRVRPEW